MTEKEDLQEKLKDFMTDEEEEEEEEGEGEATPKDFGEGQTIEGKTDKTDTYIFGESEEQEWIGVGEYGEGGQYFILNPTGEAVEYTSIWDKKEGSVSSEASAAVSEVEETEEEKELRKEREALSEVLKEKLMERMLLRRRNAFLHKKLSEHFKKRRMENVFKEEPKGLDLEKKYLTRLYAFQEFKQAQETEIEELNLSMAEYKNDTKKLEEELEEKLKHFMAKAKEVSLNLILSKTGKRISEKIVDHLLKRLIKKNEEKGRKKLIYIKIKNLIEEKERQLKAMEYFGEGLHIVKYEQMKIDNQNFSDKIEEKEDELTKMRLKTQAIMENLSQAREKTFALEDDIQLTQEKVYSVEKEFAETRERLTETRKKRDFLREEYVRLKITSGLLTKNALLRDFESSIYEAKGLGKDLEKLKKLMHDKEVELHKMALNTTFEFNSPLELSLRLPTKFKTRL